MGKGLVYAIDIINSLNKSFKKDLKKSFKIL
jgi:hypothetical protein